MAKDNTWTIVINGNSGFVPMWWQNSWPYIGNKDGAGNMTDLDILDPNVITQGPGIATLTAGDQAGAVTTLIGAILKIPTSTNVSFAAGTNLIHKISATAVTDDGTYPLTIDKGAVTGETATDIAYYKSAVYVFYNHSASAGDVAKLTVATDTLDPDWGSTVGSSGDTLEDAPHYACNGGDDVLYITNGQYVATIDEAVLTVEALDFWTDAETVSVTWNFNRVFIAVNRPNITGSNFNQSGIYRWNGVSASWEGDPIEVNGEIGALYTKNGRTYVWWKESTATGGYSFGYINGSVLEHLRSYSGGLPNQAQVFEYKRHIAWMSGQKMFMWGAKDRHVEVKLSQYMSAEYANSGGAAAPFGDPLLASYASTNFSLVKPSGYAVTSTFKTKAFKMSGSGTMASIDLIQVETEQLAAGAKCDFTLYYDQAKSNIALTQIAYATTNETIHKIFVDSVGVESFRLDCSFANGSASNPVKIRSIMISGQWVQNK